MAKASGMGFGVAKPWGDSEPYDSILAVRGRLWKVQVKAAFTVGQDGCYSFRTHDHALRPYRVKDIDALVAYVAPEECVVCAAGESGPEAESVETVYREPEEEVEV